MEEENKLKCTLCKVILPLKDFYKKRCGNYYKRCIHCTSKERERKEERADYYIHNKEDIQNYYIKNKIQISNRKKQYREDNIECLKEIEKQKRELNKCPHKRETRKCKICDFQGYILDLARCQVRSAIKYNKLKKTVDYLGCDIEQYKTHIEKGFNEENGFTWDNYGKLWHIDHIIPLKYDNPTIEQTTERLHYTNTQPLLASENIAKGNRYIG
jgi:hypothetical protein